MDYDFITRALNLMDFTVMNFILNLFRVYDINLIKKITILIRNLTFNILDVIYALHNFKI